MVCCRSVSGILRKAELILVPLYENKKSLSVSELDFLGMTLPAFNEPSVAREALFCHPWQNITVYLQTH